MVLSGGLGENIYVCIRPRVLGKKLVKENERSYFNWSTLCRGRSDEVTFICCTFELSQIMNKDLGYISKEVRVLESIGLIELVKDSSGVREKIKPVAQYDRIVLDFDLALGQASNL